MAHAPSTHRSETVPDVETLSVPIGRRCCGACVELLERRLREHPHVLRVHLDALNRVAHVKVRPATTSVAELAELAELAGECCGGRCPVPMPDATVSSHDHAHEARLQDGINAPEARAMEKRGARRNGSRGSRLAVEKDAGD